MKYLEYDIFNVRSHNYRYQARDHLHVLNIEEKMMTGPTLEKAITGLYCSVELTNVHDELIVLSTLNIFLSITAFLGNTLIFTALRRKNSLYPPSKLLYRSLAITDLCVGVIVQPLCVAYLMSVKSERWDICYNFYVALFVASYILCAVSFLYIDCNKRGQTSRLVAGTQIQKSCNFEKCLYNCNRYVGFVRCRHNKLLLESRYIFATSLHTFVGVYIHVNFLLHENLLHSPSISS